jgi:uracil-DNA glycosylase family 4
MDGEREFTNGELADLLEWWVEAGVHVTVAEEPRNWLSPPAKPASPDANIAEPSHDTLAELQNWLASSAQLPLASASARRILPHGPENPAVMLLSDAPALEDLASGQPIGGEAWKLAEKMLAAIGIAADEAYSASLTCFPSPGARMTEEDRAACAELARKHIGLVKPKRLLLLGDGPCKALLGQPLPGARGHAHKVGGVRTVATFHPRWLLQRPSDKAKAWTDLLLLMENDI